MVVLLSKRKNHLEGDKRQQFSEQHSRPFKFLHDFLLSSSPTIHINFFFSFFCSSRFTILHVLSSLSFVFVHTLLPDPLLFRRYKRCQILSIYCVASIDPTSFFDLQICLSFCKLRDRYLPLNPFLCAAYSLLPLSFSFLLPLSFSPPLSLSLSLSLSFARSFLEGTHSLHFCMHYSGHIQWNGS